MKIFITGGTGFVGSHLCRFLTAKGHRLTILSRSAKAAPAENIEMTTGNPVKPGEWQDRLKECDAVINLAGSSVFCRWSAKNRRRIMESRILTTRNIVEALKDENSAVKVLINASAVGYYGDKGNLSIDEKTPPGVDFLARVAWNWEKEARAARKSVRVVRCRLGVVMGRGGGALAKMVKPFKAGLGAPLGSGRQWFSWVHIDDLAAAFNFILETGDIVGPVNLTSPQPVTNRDFSRTLARVLDKPFFMPAIPAFFLRLVMGEAASMVLDSARVLPTVLMDRKFVFRFADLEDALRDLLEQQTGPT